MTTRRFFILIGALLLSDGVGPLYAQSKDAPAVPVPGIPTSYTKHLPALRIHAYPLMVPLNLHSVQTDLSTVQSDGSALPAGWNFLSGAAPAGQSVAKGAKSVSVADDGKGQDASESGIWLPLGEDTPVAAFRSGRDFVLVAAGQHRLDTSALPQNGALVVSSVNILDSLTVVTFTVTGDAEPALLSEGDGWSIVLRDKNIPDTPIVVQRRENALAFRPADDGERKVISFTDPSSGRRLLLGLCRSGRILPGMVLSGAGFAVRPSLVGLVVGAESDSIELRVAGKDFVLDSVTGDASDSIFRPTGPLVQGEGSSVVLTEAPLAQLRDNYRRAWTGAALGPAAQRFEKRIQAASFAAALGNWADLDGAVKTAVQDQPEGAGRPEIGRLGQISAALKGRPVENPAQDEAGNTPEDQFWRGEARLHDPNLNKEEDQKKTALLLAAGLSVAEGYTEPLRRLLLPEASAFLARYGDDTGLTALGHCKDHVEERLACALRASRMKDKDAEAQLHLLEKETDPSVFEGAKEALLASAFAGQKMNAASYVEALDTLIPASRLAGREHEVRLAEIRAALGAGQVVRAQTLLGEWSQIFPDASDDILQLKQQIAQQMEKSTSAQASDKRLEFLEQNLAQAKTPDERKDFLLALTAQYEGSGLYRQADDQLRQAVALAPPADRDGLNLRLARLDLSSGLPEQAVQDLQLGAGGHDAPLGKEASLVLARALFQQGKYNEARGALNGATDVPALLFMADMGEQAHHWQDAETALHKVLEPIGPQAPLSDEQQQVVMRLAEDISRLNDKDEIRALRARYQERMAHGPQAKMFDILTGGDMPMGAGG